MTHWLLRFGVGMISVASLFALYLVSAPPLLLRWEAGATTPTLAGWYPWPQWSSALLVAIASGLTYAAATRLGASPLWAASASLSCGLGWTLWMVALVPSAKSIALLLVGVGIAAIAWWSASKPAFAPSATAGRRTLGTAWLMLAGVCLLASGWLQPLLPPSASVQASTSSSGLVRVVVAELRPLACLVAALGAVQLWSRSRRAAVVFVAVLAIYLLLPLVTGLSPDAALLPASLLLWMAVAFGLEWIARAGSRRAMFALALVLAVLLPAERALMNYTLITRASTPFFPGSLALSLASISPGGTVLAESPDAERRVARAAAVLPVGPFRIVPIEQWARNEGSADAFAFQAIRGELEAEQVEARTTSRRVPLSVFLGMLPADNVVAIALTPFVANALSREPQGYFTSVGAPATTNAALAHALVGRARSASGALVQQDREAAHVSVTSGTPWGDPLRPSPIAIDVAADRNVAAIAVEGREIVRVPYGGAVVVTSREGHLQMVYVLTPEQRLQMPLPVDEWSVAELVDRHGNTPLPDPLFAHPQDASALLRVDGRDHSYFTTGWHAPERNGTTDFMWTSEERSRFLIPLTQPLELRVIVELSPAVADHRDPPLVGLHVNGQAFARQPAPPGRRMFEWRVPKDAWHAGANDVAIELTKLTRPLGSHDQRMLGAAVSLVRLERVIR